MPHRTLVWFSCGAASAVAAKMTAERGPCDVIYCDTLSTEHPDVFARRAAQSRALGVRLARVKGERVYLDALPLEADAPDDAIDCGPACQSPTPGR